MDVYDSEVIQALDGYNYRMAIIRGSDNQYHLTFVPTDKYNKRTEDIVCKTADEAIDKFEKNKRFYTGKTSKIGLPNN